MAVVAFFYFEYWRRSRVVAPWYALLYPVAGAVFCLTTLASMTLALARGGVLWRGTLYRLEELSKGRA